MRTEGRADMGNRWGSGSKAGRTDGTDGTVQRKGTAALEVRKGMIALAALMALQLVGCQGNGGMGSPGSSAGNSQDIAGAKADVSGDKGEMEGNAPSIGTDDQGMEGVTGKTADYDETDLDAGWDEEETVVILCSGNEAVIDGTQIGEKTGGNGMGRGPGRRFEGGRDGAPQDGGMGETPGKGVLGMPGGRGR